jgi:hypothetical protein
MRKIITHPGAVLALAALLLIIGGGCNRKTTAHSSGAMTLPGRQIKFSLDGLGGVSSAGEGAVVAFGKHKVQIEKERLLLDGKESAKFAAAVSLVEVMYSNATLTVTADGTNILTTEIKR